MQRDAFFRHKVAELEMSINQGHLTACRKGKSHPPALHSMAGWTAVAGLGAAGSGVSTSLECCGWGQPGCI